MAHEKAYFVCVAQVGSNVMLMHRSADKRLAHEIADGQPDGTGFVLEVSRNIDPGIAGGLEAEARLMAENLEGEDLRRERREAAGTPMTRDQEAAADRKSGAATARRAADLVEKGDKAVEAAARKTENRTTVPDSVKETKSDAKPGSVSQANQSNVQRPDPNAQKSVEDQARDARSAQRK